MRRRVGEGEGIYRKMMVKDSGWGPGKTWTAGKRGWPRCGTEGKGKVSV